jgi:hypothetical protein
MTLLHSPYDDYARSAGYFALLVANEERRLPGGKRPRTDQLPEESQGNDIAN